MRDCKWYKVEGGWKCEVCDRLWPFSAPPDGMNCRIDLPSVTPLPSGLTAHGLGIDRGSGDYLHDAILKWVGEGPTQECACADRIFQMNMWGPAGCREHLDEIVGWLVDEATQRGWWKYAVAVPGSRYFIKQMVLGAIEKAETEATAAQSGDS